MRLLLTSALLFAAMPARAAERLTDFPALMRALTGGQAVRIVLDYGKMTLLVDGQETPSPKAIGGMEFKAWEHFAKGVVRNERAYVVSSHTVLIEIPRLGYVQNYVRVRVYEDGEVEVTARYLKGPDHEVVMDETFKGRISDGDDENGASFFSGGK
jgi:hypothetical protein